MLQRLTHLPREARDTLFLLAVIAWVILPQVDHLPLWCSAMGAGVLLWRGRMAWPRRATRACCNCWMVAGPKGRR